MYNILKLFSLIILLPSSLSGQSYITEYFSIKDGLPSNAMRSINEDRDGNVWLVTDNGVAQYNGNFFQVYKSFDNLKTTAVFDIFPSSDGRVFLIDYVKNLNYIYRDSLHTLNTGNFHIKTPYEYNGKAYGLDQDGVTYLIDKDSVVNEYSSLSPDILRNMPARLSWRIAYPYAFIVRKDTVISFNLMTFETKTKTFPKERLLLESVNSFHIYGRVYFVKKELMICYNPVQDTFLCKSFGDSSGTAYHVKQLIFGKGTIQVTTENGLVVADLDLEQIDSLKINTQQEGIISIFMDSGKNFWLLTSNGLGYISSYFREMTLYTLRGVRKMTYFNGYFYLVNNSGQILMYDTTMNLHRNIAVEDVRSVNNSPVFYRILNRKDSLVIATNKNITVIKKDGKIYSLRPSKLSKEIFHSIKDIAYNKNNGLNVLTSEGISQVDVLSNAITYKPIGRYSRILSGRSDSFFVFDNNNSFLLKNGKFFPYTNKLFDSIKKVTGFPIPDYFIANDSNWIAGTNNYVFCLNIHTNKLTVFKMNDNIAFMKCENGDLWVATMSMIYRYKKGMDNEYSFHSIYYNFVYGLYQGLQDITVVGDHFFLVSNYGITKVPVKEPIKNRGNYLDTTNISRIIYGKDDHYSDKDTAIKLQYQSSNISIYFSCNTLGYDKEVTYSAYLEGIDEQWQSTNVNFVTYTSLKPGKYRLHYYASLSKYDLRSREQIMVITISPLWWQHFIFKAISIIVIILILSFILVKISLNRKNKILRKALIEKNISNVKLSALQSQMNPHFIFNAMASIQGFLKQNKNDVAEECLTEFAGLIRSYLDFSSKQFITLSQELETLTLYTSIEKKRFEGKFDVIFNVDTEKKLDDINIPPLIIQPFVENAIVHGLYHKLNGKGLLEITFKEKNGQLIVTVEDNGIGRQKANSINSVMSKNASRGLGLISERIRILNENSIISININTTDKKDIYGEPDGVLVTIYIKNQ